MGKWRSKAFLGLPAIVIGMFFLAASLFSQDFVPNELLVKFHSGTPDSILSAVVSGRDLSPILQKRNSPSVRRITPVFSFRKQLAIGNAAVQTAQSFSAASQVVQITFVNRESADTAMSLLMASPSVEYVQRNYIYKLDQLPNDSAASSQWNLDHIGIFQLWASGFFDIPRDSVRVGILDTGVDYLHPDLKSRIYVNQGETGLDEHGNDKRFNGIDDDGNGYVDDWQGYDFVDLQTPDIGDWSTRDNDPMDENGHGTAVAGIVGARSNNGIGIAGISPVAQIVPLRAFTAGGFGTDADIAAAVIYAADNGVQVLNMSFGDVISSPLLKDVLHYAHERNVVLVASSGNDGTSFPHYPSDFSDVISVGSTSQANERSFFSSYGSSLALMAPGEAIPTLKLGGGYQGSFSGTSAAAPHVSAVASLLISLDQSNRNSNPNYVPLTNEEVRANLLAGCEDLGDKGWDNFYGAGLLNARILFAPPQRNVVQISSPSVDAQISANIVPILGTATTDQLTWVGLSYGTGDSPSSWTLITQSQGIHYINDTLALWNISALEEGIYTLRLQVKNIQTGDVENRVRLAIIRSGPRFTSFIEPYSVISQDEFDALTTLSVDRPCTARLWYRNHSSQGPFSSLAASGFQIGHFFLLTQKDFLPGALYDLYVEATDQAGRSVRLPPVGSGYVPFQFASRKIATTGFTELSPTLPSGFLLNKTGSISGKPHVVLNAYDASGNFGKLKAYQYANGSFSVVDSTARAWVPRDLKDAFNNDGRMSTLVQDQGVTELFTSNPDGSTFFANKTFVDSSDVWGSQLYDFDGDGKLDLIARSSSEYLIYKNMGENKFQLMARLQNTSNPLQGDAANQFGPPRTLVGDFSGSGSTEIIFADYDGDLLMYRLIDKQAFKFRLAMIDSTALFETSDFLTMGDFNGDGQLDFAVAGHSNLDFNDDREYDAPTWNVRIFSHRPADSLNTFYKLWDQTFYGVKAGFSYDNGLSSGKIDGRPNDQLFLSLNPYLYVIDFDAALQNFAPVWVHSSSSNSVLVSDFNGNGVPEFGFNADGKIRFFEKTSAALKPQTPWAVSATPITAHSVQIQWSSSDPTGTHRIYRDTTVQPLTLLATVSATSYVDTAVLPEKNYWYSVSLVNPSESEHSSAVSTMPHNPGRIDSAHQQSIDQISVSMSVSLDPNRFSSAAIQADDSLSPTSIALRSPSKLMLTFGQPLSYGAHTLRIQNLFDIYGMAIDTSQRFLFNAFLVKGSTFYVKQAAFISQALLSIEFSDTLAASGLDIANYTFSNSLKNFRLKEVKLDSLTRTKVYLSLQDNEHLTPIGLRMDLTASERIQDTHGRSLNDGKGQTVSLVIDVNNLDQILIFPNPLRYSAIDFNRSHVTFANVPQYCRIDIFTPNGMKIATLRGNTRAEGIRWDLKDDLGKPVGSGIYVFLATQLDENSAELRRKTGKFAIIR